MVVVLTLLMVVAKPVGVLLTVVPPGVVVVTEAELAVVALVLMDPEVRPFPKTTF